MISPAQDLLSRILLAIAQAAKSQVLLLTNAAFVAVAAVSSACLGFLFWLVAARSLPADTIGMASAVVSAMSLTGTMAEIGLGTLLMGSALKRRDAAARLISAALCVAACVAVMLCLIWIAVARLLTLKIGNVLGTPFGGLIFIAGTMGGVLALVLDGVSTGYHVSSLRMIRELVFASGKLVLLILLLTVTLWAGSTVLLTAWVAALFLSLLLMVGLAERGGRGLIAAPDFTLLGKMLPSSLEHHALNMVATAPTMFLPILVTEIVSTEVNAPFFLALMILQVMLLGPASISSALYAVSDSDPAGRRSGLRFSLVVATAMCIVETAAFVFFLEAVLGLFNPAYPTLAGPHLSWIGLAIPARAAKFFYIAVARLNGRMRQGSALLTVCGTIEITGAAVGGVMAGASGLVIGWLITAYLELILLLPSIRAETRTQSMSYWAAHRQNDAQSGSRRVT